MILTVIACVLLPNINYESPSVSLCHSNILQVINYLITCEIAKLTSQMIKLSVKIMIIKRYLQNKLNKLASFLKKRRNGEPLSRPQSLDIF